MLHDTLLWFTDKFEEKTWCQSVEQVKKLMIMFKLYASYIDEYILFHNIT